MAASIKQVAARAGVSIGTVSNVLNRPTLVSERTRGRVLEAIDELGFVRNESARQLRAGRSHTIALVVLDARNPFFTDVAAGAEDLASQRGMLVMLCNSADDPQRESHHLRVLEEQRVSGILITPTGEGSYPRLAELAQRGTPVVLVDRVGGLTEQCSVAVDDVLGGRLAARHLIGNGHRDLAFVGGPATLSQVTDRLAGMRLEASATPEVILRSFETAALTVEQGREAAGRILDGSDADRPTGIFCANDLLAMGVLQELTTRAIKVPDDIALIGYDDIIYAAAAAVPLSSISQPRADLGRAAIDLLLQELDEGPDHKHRQVTFKPELVVRRSSDHRVPVPETSTGPDSDEQ